MMLMNGGGESEADSNAMAYFLPLMLMMSEEKTDEDGNVVSTTSCNELLSRHLNNGKECFVNTTRLDYC